ncbi:Zn-ribbon domain-containing protein [Halomicrobium urmianum]|uniref:Zn-ribbon domain-containing protein n=1 Tax=Halomicrobium urmianum TaxID=1586233 RepID=UPI001CD9B704|nr:Zn-ribbon domain-containing protein [Halomicrobium urmianum]
MPHQCTNCGRTFDDGSKQMLSGCPDCGGNKFQFKPDGGPTPDAEPPEPPEPAGSSVARTVGKTAATVKDFVSSSDDESASVGAPEPADASSEAGTADAAATEAGAGDATSPEVGTAGAEVNGAGTTPAEDRSASASARSPPETEGSHPAGEDSAQASARSEVIAPDEIPSEPATDEEHHFDPVSTEESADSSTGSEGAEPVDRPDLDELREELNNQFESIKVLDPGKYELNLMELYDREEYIIALREDGRYSIQVPENFRE